MVVLVFASRVLAMELLSGRNDRRNNRSRWTESIR